MPVINHTLPVPAFLEHTARFVLNDWEMGHVQGRLHRDPLTRRLLLTGQADDFQRAELARIMGSIPGVSTANWSAVALACAVAPLCACTLPIA